MEDSNRKDRTVEIIPGYSIDFTRKVMPNGEERERIKYPDGSTLITTKQGPWESDVPWQPGHQHIGRFENYILLKGFMLFVFQLGPYDRIETRYYEKAGDSISFNPPVPHMVLLGAHTIIKTLQFGDPIGNPDRKNDDWWPLIPELECEMREVGTQALKQFLGR